MSYIKHDFYNYIRDAKLDSQSQINVYGHAHYGYLMSYSYLSFGQTITHRSYFSLLVILRTKYNFSISRSETYFQKLVPPETTLSKNDLQQSTLVTFIVFPLFIAFVLEMISLSFDLIHGSNDLNSGPLSQPSEFMVASTEMYLMYSN